MTPQQENLRIVVRHILRSWYVSDVSYHDAYTALDAALEEFRTMGTVLVDGETVFPHWYALWREHDRVTLAPAQDSRHRAPGVAAPVPIEASSNYRELPAPVDRGPGAGWAATPRMLGSTKSYRLGRKLIYVDSAAEDKHWTTTLHWEEYLRLRKRVPGTVVIVDQAHELVQAMVDQGVLV